MGGARRKATFAAGPTVHVGASPSWTRADVTHPATVKLQLTLTEPGPHEGRAVVATLTEDQARALHAVLGERLGHLATHTAPATDTPVVEDPAWVRRPHQWVASAHVRLDVWASDEESAREGMRTAITAAGMRLAGPGNGPSHAAGGVRLDVHMAERARLVALGAWPPRHEGDA